MKETTDEQALPIVDFIYGFVSRHIWPLMIFGGVTLALAVGAMKVSSHMLAPKEVTAPSYTRSNWVMEQLKSMNRWNESEISLWSTAYIALKGNPKDAKLAEDARKRLIEAQRKVMALRASLDKFRAFPMTYSGKVENAEEPLYKDASGKTVYTKGQAYALDVVPEDPRKGKVKRTVLAVWVLLNGLFAGIIAFVDWRKKAVNR